MTGDWSFPPGMEPISPMADAPVQMPASSPTATAGTTVFATWQRWFIPAAVMTLVLDLVSKQALFALAPTMSFPGWIRLAWNQGVAWSLFAEHPWLVVGLTIVLIPVLAWVWWRHYRQVGALENLAFGLVLGGAIGNAVDRIGMALGQLQGVRDFIYVDLGFAPFHPWPTFNLADSGICIGFALLVLLSFRPAAKPAASSQA